MGRHITPGPHVGAWVARQIDGFFDPARSQAIGLRRDDGEIIGGVFYEQWNGRSIVAHCAFTGPLTSGYFHAIYHYPFVVCGVAKLICPIYSSNARSVHIAKHSGYALEATITDAAPQGDILIFTMTKAQCRFLEDKYSGKIRTITPAGT